MSTETVWAPLHVEPEFNEYCTSYPEIFEPPSSKTFQEIVASARPTSLTESPLITGIPITWNTAITLWGNRLFELLGVPNCRELDVPQHLSSLAEFRPQACDPPTETDVKTSGETTRWGKLELFSEPLPNWPVEFRPQQLIPPPLISAHEVVPPAITWLAAIPLTNLGEVAVVVVPVPIFPDELFPQHHTSLLVFVAQVCDVPKDIDWAFVKFGLTGIVLLDVEEFPIWWFPPDPQQLRVRFALMAQVVDPPASKASAPVMESVSTGETLVTVDPFPSWPLEFDPQHFTVPEARSAHEWFDPVVTFVAFEIPETSVGDSVDAPPGTPVCPDAFAPQQYTEPFAVTAHACCESMSKEITFDRPGTGLGACESVVDPTPSWP